MSGYNPNKYSSNKYPSSQYPSQTPQSLIQKNINRPYSPTKPIYDNSPLVFPNTPQQYGSVNRSQGSLNTSSAIHNKSYKSDRSEISAAAAAANYSSMDHTKSISKANSVISTNTTASAASTVKIVNVSNPEPTTSKSNNPANIHSMYMNAGGGIQANKINVSAKTSQSSIVSSNTVNTFKTVSINDPKQSKTKSNTMKSKTDSQIDSSKSNVTESSSSDTVKLNFFSNSSQSTIPKNTYQPKKNYNSGGGYNKSGSGYKTYKPYNNYNKPFYLPKELQKPKSFYKPQYAKPIGSKSLAKPRSKKNKRPFSEAWTAKRYYSYIKYLQQSGQIKGNMIPYFIFLRMAGKKDASKEKTLDLRSNKPIIVKSYGLKLNKPKVKNLWTNEKIKEHLADYKKFKVFEDMKVGQSISYFTKDDDGYHFNKGGTIISINTDKRILNYISFVSRYTKKRFCRSVSFDDAVVYVKNSTANPVPKPPKTYNKTQNPIIKNTIKIAPKYSSQTPIQSIISSAVPDTNAKKSYMNLKADIKNNKIIRANDSYLNHLKSNKKETIPKDSVSIVSNKTEIKSDPNPILLKKIEKLEEFIAEQTKYIKALKIKLEKANQNMGTPKSSQT